VVGTALPSILLTRARRSTPTTIASALPQPNLGALLDEIHAPRAVPLHEEKPAVPDLSAQRRSDIRGPAAAFEVSNSASPRGTHAKSRWNFAIIGICSAAAIITLLATAKSLLVGSTLDLEIKAENSNVPILGIGGGAMIRNIGHAPIQIFEIRVNDREDCRPRIVNGLMGASEQKPFVLNVGDSVGLLTSCGIVRMTISADRGSAEYSFGGD
jgi:hypothetical protein